MTWELALERLSDAEREIIGDVLAGWKNADIARRRGRSAKAIGHRLGQAMRKLGVRSRGELAAMANAARVEVVPLHGRRALTEREDEVISRVAAGDANKVIGYELGIATSTVSVHIVHAMRKLGVASRVALVARWTVLPRGTRPVEARA